MKIFSYAKNKHYYCYEKIKLNMMRYTLKKIGYKYYGQNSNDQGKKYID